MATEAPSPTLSRRDLIVAGAAAGTVALGAAALAATRKEPSPIPDIKPNSQPQPQPSVKAEIPSTRSEVEVAKNSLQGQFLKDLISNINSTSQPEPKTYLQSQVVDQNGEPVLSPPSLPPISELEKRKAPPTDQTILQKETIRVRWKRGTDYATDFGEGELTGFHGLQVFEQPNLSPVEVANGIEKLAMVQILALNRAKFGSAWTTFSDGRTLNQPMGSNLSVKKAPVIPGEFGPYEISKIQVTYIKDKATGAWKPATQFLSPISKANRTWDCKGTAECQIIRIPPSEVQPATR